MMYNPEKFKLSLIDTGQKNYIERFYSDTNSKIILTNMDKEFDNEFCEINSNQCIKFSKDYRVNDVTTLDDYIIAVGINKNAQWDQENLLKVRKYNHDL